MSEKREGKAATPNNSQQQTKSDIILQQVPRGIVVELVGF